ncbi:MAG: hypothetical protein WAV95_11265 [Azonexus sp.]
MANDYKKKTFDRPIFMAEYTKFMVKNPRYNANAIPQVMYLLEKMQSDARITDLRWIAYMLATVAWETTSPLTFTYEKKDKKGKVVTLKQKKWLFTMAPVEEVGHGKGRKYHDPVKVQRLPNGTAQITERDGDQFLVKANGKCSAITKKATMGSKDGMAAHKRYEQDTGVEQCYFGRGYVQLTWWSNYAEGGASIGRGLDLLFDPELVKQPEVAYALMAQGMITGSGFANGRRLERYFSEKKSDYKGARAMVNGSDCADKIAELAECFEKILLQASVQEVSAS